MKMQYLSSLFNIKKRYDSSLMSAFSEKIPVKWNF